MRDYQWQLELKYSPDQPRVPAGDPAGGRWTSRQTVAARVGQGGMAPVDRNVKKVVEAFNAAGLETSQSCSGHVCPHPLESHLSYRHREHQPRSVAAHEAVKNLLESGRLRLPWRLVDRGMGWHDLHVEGGWFGDGSMPSSLENVVAAKDDLDEMAEVVAVEAG